MIPISFKGYKNIVLTREFYNFSLTHPLAMQYYNYIKEVR